MKNRAELLFRGIPVQSSDLLSSGFREKWNEEEKWVFSCLEKQLFKILSKSLS